MPTEPLMTLGEYVFGVDSAATERAAGDIRFLREFAGRMTPGSDAPVYLLLHVIAPHVPIVVDADCRYLGRPLPVSADSFNAQARCALNGVQTVLDRLRALELYDRSAIVVTSDHGMSRLSPGDHPLRGIHTPVWPLDQIATDATPLLAIKPIGARGPLRTSYAPTMITDLPATLLDLAELPDTLRRGTSVLALDPATPRERTYAHHEWGMRNDWASPYFDVLHVFSVGGRVTSPESWRYRQAIFDPTGDLEEQRWAHRLGLVAVDDGTTAGMAPPVYRTDDYAVFYASPEARRITFDVRKASGALPSQTVTVRIDGQVVGEHELASDARWHTFSYPVETRNAANIPFSVELLLRPSRREGEGPDSGGMLLYDRLETQNFNNFRLDVGSSADTRFLFGGWWDAERSDGFTFRWAKGAESSLLVPLKESVDYRLHVRCAPFGYPGSDDQVMQVHVNGVPVDTVVLREGFHDYEVVLPQRVIRAGVNDLRFSYRYAKSPREVGLSPDARVLAVRFDTIAFMR